MMGNENGNEKMIMFGGVALSREEFSKRLQQEIFVSSFQQVTQLIVCVHKIFQDEEIFNAIEEIYTVDEVNFLETVVRETQEIAEQLSKRLDIACDKLNAIHDAKCIRGES